MKKTIVFVTAGLEFDGDSIYTKALGGSESAMIYMANAIAAMGNEVIVYCECKRPDEYAGVIYKHYKDFGKDIYISPDVLIVSRFTEFLSVPLSPKMTILWAHDTNLEDIQTALGQVDQLYCLSDYHAKLYENQYGIKNFITKTTNGYDPRLIKTPLSFDERKNNFIYASRPERGLKFLLEKIWVKIVEKNPDARLHICGYGNDFNIPKEMRELYAEIDTLIDNTAGVVKTGYLAKPAYYNLLSQCAYMLYPTDFPEISCINAIEAQAAGCMVISSYKYALIETVQTATLIDAEYGSDEYVEQFLWTVDNYSGKTHYELEMSLVDMSGYTWDSVAHNWITNINYNFIMRSNDNAPKVLDQLIYNSDIYAAWKLTNNSKYKKMLVKASVDNLVSSDYRMSVDEDEFFGPRNVELIKAFGERIRRFPNKKIRVLDLGSNQGILSLPLLKRFGDYIETCTLFDSCGGVLEQVKDVFGSKYPQLKTINDSLLNISAHKVTADFVILGEILEHIEDTVTFLRYLTSYTCDEDTTYFFTTPTGPWESIIKEEHNNPKNIHHIHHFELEDIREIFRDHNPTITLAKTGVLGRRMEPCDNFCFWYTAHHYNVNKFYAPNYNLKFTMTRPYKSISTCMIVKDEENNLSRCLKSVREISDEIIVVDTGSKDSTVDIAKKYTDNIFEHEFVDFADARNFSISKATGDYILWIDADEELVNSRILHKYIVSNYYTGVVMDQKQLLTREQHDSGVNNDIAHDRFFKNNMDIEFVGCVHEYPAINGQFISDRMIYQPAVHVLHYGGANVSHVSSKVNERNSSLVYKNLESYPNILWFRHYIIQDCWNRFLASEFMDDNCARMAIKYFHTQIAPTGDYETTKMALKYLQLIYKAMMLSEIDIDGNEISEYTIDSGVSIFAFNENEAEMFLRIVS